jgi:hypothetical protein
LAEAAGAGAGGGTTGAAGMISTSLKPLLPGREVIGVQIY